MTRTPLLFLISALAVGCDGERGRFQPARAAPAHLVVVSIDTLRADCLQGAGPRRAATPTLDALARGGLALANAHAHVPLTLPSHATLFTGRLPTALALHDNSPFPLRADVPTLATLLAERGFATAAVIGGQPLARGCGLERGFEHYDDPPRGDPGAARFGERTAREVTDQALAEWSRRTNDARRFLFVHYFDPHQPYAPPPDCVRGDAADPVARYLGEVAFVDRELARLVAALRKGGERCLLFVTSDHGEGLGDHGERTHGYQVFESTLHVPMVLVELEGERTAVPAGLRAADGARLVGMIDLLPTLLRELGVEAPAGLPGVALQEPPPAGATCYVESLASSLQFGWAQITGVRGAGGTLLRAGADVPAAINGLGAVVAGAADERLLLDDAAAPPPSEELSAWRATLVAARAAADHEPAADPDNDPNRRATRLAPMPALGYVGGATDRARHALLPFAENAALPSPLARRAEIDALLAAVERLEGGDAAGAAAAFTALLAGDPANRAALFFRARARLHGNHPAAPDGRFAREAAADLAAVLALEPTYGGAALLRAKALGLAGEFDGALAQLAQLAVADGSASGEDAAVEHLLGSLLLQKSSAGRQNPRYDAEQGYSHLLRSLELDPAQEALAASVAAKLQQLAATPTPPGWVAAAIERLKRRRSRRYRPGGLRYRWLRERRTGDAFGGVSRPANSVRANGLGLDVLH